MVLEREIIHGIFNPSSDWSYALHVYGGKLDNPRRSLWNPFTLKEEPFRLSTFLACEKEMMLRKGKQQLPVSFPLAILTTRRNSKKRITTNMPLKKNRSWSQWFGLSRNRYRIFERSLRLPMFQCRQPSSGTPETGKGAWKAGWWLHKRDCGGFETHYRN